jgi:hypothetical protein
MLKAQAKYDESRQLRLIVLEVTPREAPRASPVLKHRSIRLRTTRPVLDEAPSSCGRNSSSDT